MKERSKKKNLEIDEQLADFTDRVLARKSDQTESQMDEELRRVERTILRLKRAVPTTQPDDAAIRQMQANLKARLHNESERTNIWRKWFKAYRPRPRIAFAIAAVAILIFVMLIAPHLIRVGPSMTAVATRPSSFIFVISILAGITLLVIWIKRRK